MNEELINKMERVKNNLDNAITQLDNARSILDQNITFNNQGFKHNCISNLSQRINTQIYNINNTIIPNIEQLKGE